MSTVWVMFVEVRSLLTSVKRLLMTTFRLPLIFHTLIFFWEIMVGPSEMANVISQRDLILNFISEEQKLKSWNLKIYTNIYYHSVSMGQEWYSLINIFTSIKQMNCQRELIKFQFLNIMWKFRRKFYLLSECSFRCRRVQNLRWFPEAPRTF